MTALIPSSLATADELVPLGPQPGHTLGPVADDWADIEVWLSAVADNSPAAPTKPSRPIVFT
jgi:hypothetical protein